MQKSLITISLEFSLPFLISLLLTYAFICHEGVRVANDGRRITFGGWLLLWFLKLLELPSKRLPDLREALRLGLGI
jgi:hypothetical protein